MTATQLPNELKGQPDDCKAHEGIGIVRCALIEDLESQIRANIVSHECWADGVTWSDVVSKIILTHEATRVGLEDRIRHLPWERLRGMGTLAIRDTAMSYVWEGLVRVSFFGMRSFPPYFQRVLTNSVKRAVRRERMHSGLQLADDVNGELQGRDWAMEEFEAMELQTLILETIVGGPFSPQDKYVLHQLLIEGRNKVDVAEDLGQTRSNISKISKKCFPVIQKAVAVWREVDE